MVSYPTWQAWYKDCDNGENTGNPACALARGQMNTEIGEKIDPYALDYPVCNTLHGPSASTINERVWFMKQVVKDAQGRPVPGIYNKLVGQFEKDVDKRRRLGDFDFPPDNYYPCESNWNTEYLNLPAVQSAIYAKPTLWTDCSVKINYSIKSMTIQWNQH